MGYLHIENLYRPEAQEILLFKKVFVMEKIHGSSASIGYNKDRVTFFAGGESHERFVALFDQAKLEEKFKANFQEEVTVFGEVYGGKCQGMRHTYGSELRFIAFDVRVGDLWLSVPQAAKVVEDLGLEFVPWCEASTEISVLDALRDAPSIVAQWRGCGNDKPREGIVIRSPIEVKKNNGERLIAKHKGEAFAERKHPPKVVDPSKLEVLQKTEAIVDEWVTVRRLEHVLQRFPLEIGMEATKDIISAMIEDVIREASGEIVDSKEVRTAIGRRTAVMFKTQLVTNLIQKDVSDRDVTKVRSYDKAITQAATDYAGYLDDILFKHHPYGFSDDDDYGMEP